MVSAIPPLQSASATTLSHGTPSAALVDASLEKQSFIMVPLLNALEKANASMMPSVISAPKIKPRSNANQLLTTQHKSLGLASVTMVTVVVTKVPVNASMVNAKSGLPLALVDFIA